MQQATPVRVTHAPFQTLGIEAQTVAASGLATGQKDGYVFQLTDCSAGAEGGPNVKYQVVAYPLRVNQTGLRAFCSDESGVIKAHSGSARRCVERGVALQ